MIWTIEIIKAKGKEQGNWITVHAGESTWISEVRETSDTFSSSQGWAPREAGLLISFCYLSSFPVTAECSLNCPSGTQHHVCASVTQQGFLNRDRIYIGGYFSMRRSTADTNRSATSVSRSAMTQSENEKSGVWSFISSFITDFESDLAKSFNLPLPRYFTCNMKIIILVTYPLGCYKG